MSRILSIDSRVYKEWFQHNLVYTEWHAYQTLTPPPHTHTVYELYIAQAINCINQSIFYFNWKIHSRFSGFGRVNCGLVFCPIFSFLHCLMSDLSLPLGPTLKLSLLDLFIQKLLTWLLFDFPSVVDHLYCVLTSYAPLLTFSTHFVVAFKSRSIQWSFWSIGSCPFYPIVI